MLLGRFIAVREHRAMQGKPQVDVSDCAPVFAKSLLRGADDVAPVREARCRW